MWFIVKPLNKKSKVVVLSRLYYLFRIPTSAAAQKTPVWIFPAWVFGLSRFHSWRLPASECASLDQKRHFNVDSFILMPAAYVRVPASLSGNHWKSDLSRPYVYTSNPSKHVCAGLRMCARVRVCVCVLHILTRAQIMAIKFSSLQPPRQERGR